MEQLRDLTGEETAALQEFACKTGHNWKLELSGLWQSGAIPMPLYGLRNTHGGAWLTDYQLPPPPPAKDLFEFVEKYGLHGVTTRKGCGWEVRVRLPSNDRTVLLHHPGTFGDKLAPRLAFFLRIGLEDHGVAKGLKKFLGPLYQEALVCKEASNAIR